MSENFSRAERRRQKHEMQKLKKHESKQTIYRSSTLIVMVVLFILIAVFALWYFMRFPDAPNNEIKVSIMSREHTSNTDEVAYNSNPPTSGPHFSDWNKEWKFYESELPIGGLIHNMEHGGVVLWYTSSVNDVTKAQLKKFTEDNFKVIASVHEDMPAPIALSAWGVYELFDVFDEAGMKRFYERNLNRAPENIYP